MWEFWFSVTSECWKLPRLLSFSQFVPPFLLLKLIYPKNHRISETEAGVLPGCVPELVCSIHAPDNGWGVAPLLGRDLSDTLASDPIRLCRSSPSTLNWAWKTTGGQCSSLKTRDENTMCWWTYGQPVAISGLSLRFVSEIESPNQDPVDCPRWCRLLGVLHRSPFPGFS